MLTTVANASIALSKSSGFSSSPNNENEKKIFGERERKSSLDLE